jgi:hypothetical protein
MTPFAQLCGAPLRNKPGRTCRAFALKDSPWGRCRIHAGRPPGSGSPEGRAATAAGHAAYYAKRKAAIRRGEAVAVCGGRPKRWPIPRPWRFKLSPEDEATVIRAMLASDARSGVTRPPWSPIPSPRGAAKGLNQLERFFILRLNDCSRPLRQEEMEQLYALAREGEAILGLPGSDRRLERLAWERHQFLLRALTRTGLRHAPPAAPATSSPPETPHLGSPSPHETSKLGSPFEPENGSPVESEAERKARMEQAAYERSQLIVKAGCAMGERRRLLGEMAASRVPDPVRIGPRLTIAPWLYKR